jgi:hypothetical protein
VPYSECPVCGLSRRAYPGTIAGTCPRCRMRGKAVFLTEVSRFSRLPQGAQFGTAGAASKRGLEADDRIFPDSGLTEHLPFGD